MATTKFSIEYVDFYATYKTHQVINMKFSTPKFFSKEQSQ